MQRPYRDVISRKVEEVGQMRKEQLVTKGKRKGNRSGRSARAIAGKPEGEVGKG